MNKVDISSVCEVIGNSGYETMHAINSLRKAVEGIDSFSTLSLENTITTSAKEICSALGDLTVAIYALKAERMT